MDNALAYLLGHVPSKRFMVVFRLIAMGLIFLGAGLTLDLVWNLSDVLMGVMVLINIPVIAVSPVRRGSGNIPSSAGPARTPCSGLRTST